MNNPYLPLPMRLEKNFIETEDKNIRTFTLTFVNKEDEEKFQYMPGQFAEVCVYGKGEAPFGIASSPTEPGKLVFSVMKVGKVTTALHDMPEGTLLGVRGPLGNYYPLEEIEGKDLVIVGGGFAYTTLRSTIAYILNEKNRARFGKLTVIYGARNPGLFLYKDEIAEWQKRDDIEFITTIDREVPGWTGRVGFIPAVTEQVAPSSENSYAIVCGPPVMIKFTLPVLEKLGFPPERIVNSLENRMKCGIGMCGRCNVGNKFVCKDGPVFTLAQLQKLPGEY
ncbi:oxidoreductase FAD/NAD(P)-binding domain protein [Desulfofarcimen acetoxidans DSM 771]|jgi:NAD(P)H-flavin reductase|uniref:Oxidoreductase FAD/NAD(P)-binding domain protein n=1 Tax=Desulfofarcimen acetoxidans (strain ATCC 49208 / DSM 771 / KCTC 5769 / VKM B-1644 / 5575) TaxID=485916 RepID=C8W5I1_DESAS|nr:FAD/NAD(P)-binding protein [Desulfofarcimen acetoxidans]ACV62163.1 oxidoreductase FAD/NAD(P)-binding domain protein [Desulfofarcimen acetoxidans DSM 771]